jgi:hypothetical protein
MVQSDLAELEGGLLTSRGIASVFHYAPLQYLLFITRSRALFSKDELSRQGFTVSHFRRTSRSRDNDRGFSNYVHLTLDEYPPILKAKLDAGFPHFEIRVPAAYVERGLIHLCRYNIAMCRNHLHSKKPAPESDATGRYCGTKQIPTAETVIECEALLNANFGKNMIELLVPETLSLPDTTSLVFFDEADRALASNVVSPLTVDWSLEVSGRYSYKRSAMYVNLVEDFLQHARADEGWKGNGLDFDSV